MVSSKEIKERLEAKRGDSNKGYLVCNKCGGYYELQEGESPDDFDECQCGGDLKYIANLPDYADDKSDDVSADDKDAPKTNKVAKSIDSSSSSKPGTIKMVEDWFFSKSTPIKLGIGIGALCICAIILIGIFGLLSPDTGPLSGAELEQFKASCKEISFDQLDKDPDAYAGQNVKYTGEIIQIFEYGDHTEMRVAVTRDTYGWNYDDVIYVVYEKKTDFVEDDVITIWGTVDGSFTYESAIGAQITLPKITARAIEYSTGSAQTSSTSSSSNTSTTTNSLSNVIIAGSTAHRENNEYIIEGTVQNNGKQDVEFVKVTAKGYDSSNNLVDTDWTYTESTTIPPGEKTSFKITFFDYDNKIVRYDLQLGL